MSESMSILIVGAGELGTAVVEALSARPESFRISVLIRASTIESHDQVKIVANNKLQNLGAHLIPGDIVNDNVDDFARIFADYHTVIICAGFNAGVTGVQKKLCLAALKAQVSRYVPWQFGVDYDTLGQGSSQDLFDEQLEVRELLRSQSATKWIIVSVGIFMSFLFEPWWGVIDIENKTVRGLGSWDTQITVTAAEDIGVITAAILANKPEIENEVCFIAGETLTYAQLANNVEAGLGYSMKRELWSPEFLQRELADDPENGLKKYRPIFASNKGIAWNHSTSWNGKTDMKTVTTMEWTRRLAAKDM